MYNALSSSRRLPKHYNQPVHNQFARFSSTSRVNSHLRIEISTFPRKIFKQSCKIVFVLLLKAIMWYVKKTSVSVVNFTMIILLQQVVVEERVLLSTCLVSHRKDKDHDSGDVWQCNIYGEVGMFTMLASFTVLWSKGEQSLQRFLQQTDTWVMNLQNYHIATI